MMSDEELFRKAISDPTRFQIMMMLCCEWMSVNDVVDKLGGKVKQPTVSHHLKELEEAGLVSLREEGRYRYYTLNRDYYNVCCGMLVRAGNPGYDMQLVPADTIPVNAIKVSGN